MSSICECPYYDEVAATQEDRNNGYYTPSCRNPESCDYPFYCPILEEKKKNGK